MTPRSVGHNFADRLASGHRCNHGPEVCQKQYQNPQSGNSAEIDGGAVIARGSQLPGVDVENVFLESIQLNLKFQFFASEFCL